jgi:hypothetical protein
LQLNQLEQVQRDVAALLEHGLNPPPQLEPTPPEAAPTAAAEDVAPAAEPGAQAESEPAEPS